MAERKKGAAITLSSDRNEILLDGMPASIASPPGRPSPDPRWYALRYMATAPPGLPPALEASSVRLESDAEDRWLKFLMEPPAHATRRQPNCILRVKVDDVARLTEHASMREAITAAFAADE